MERCSHCLLTPSILCAVHVTGIARDYLHHLSIVRFVCMFTPDFVRPRFPLAYPAVLINFFSASYSVYRLSSKSTTFHCPTVLISEVELSINTPPNPPSKAQRLHFESIAQCYGFVCLVLAVNTHLEKRSGRERIPPWNSRPCQRRFAAQ